MTTDRSTLLLIHGFPLDAAMWDDVRSCLDPAIPVAAPSLPGLDGGALPDGEPSLDAWADALLARHPGPLVVVGMSMGGYTALALADRAPDRVVGLGLVSTHPYADTDEQRRGRTALVEKILAEGPAAAAAAMLGRLFTAVPPGASEAVRAAAGRVGAEGLVYALRAMAARPDRSACWAGFPRPCAVVHGDGDAIFPEGRARAYAALNPRAVYTVLAGVAHHTPAEAPSGVAAAISALWERCLAKGV